MTGIIMSSRMTIRRDALLQVFQRFPAIGHCRRLEPLERQQLRHHLSQIVVVFDDEDGTVGDRRLRHQQQK